MLGIVKKLLKTKKLLSDTTQQCFAFSANNGIKCMYQWAFVREGSENNNVPRETAPGINGMHFYQVSFERFLMVLKQKRF